LGLGRPKIFHEVEDTLAVPNLMEQFLFQA